jgi:pyruvate carboxylase
MRAASEMGIRTVSIYSREDRFALHRFKADDDYLVGEGEKPLQAYLDIPDVIRASRRLRPVSMQFIPAMASCPRTRILRRACAAAGIIFVGPDAGSDDDAGQQGRSAQRRSGGRRAG